MLITTKIRYTDGKIKTFKINLDVIKSQSNIINVIRSNKHIYGHFCHIQRIYTVRKNYRSHYFLEINYDAQFEYWKECHIRVERTNETGFEDYTGYGSRTEGRKNRFYIGKSTGWLPIYLEILRSDSHGGSALFYKGVFSVVQQNI